MGESGTPEKILGLGNAFLRPDAHVPSTVRDDHGARDPTELRVCAEKLYLCGKSLGNRRVVRILSCKELTSSRGEAPVERKGESGISFVPEELDTARVSLTVGACDCPGIVGRAVVARNEFPIGE